MIREELKVKKLPLEKEHHQALQCMKILDSYYQWIWHLIRPHIGQRVLDAGCGIGNFSSLISSNAQYVLAIDLSPQNIESLKKRFQEAKNIEIMQADITDDLSKISHKKLDTLVCLDVVEHVEDDEELLRNFGKCVQPGGHLILKVPACPWLFGSIDVASGHLRRYSPEDLIRKSEAAGWELVKCSYMNIFGVFPYWLKSRVIKHSTNFSRSIPKWQLYLVKYLTPALERIDRLIGPPIGQSLILIARRKPQDPSSESASF